MVKNTWFSPITSFGFGFQSERSRKYVSPSLSPWIDNPQFSRSENKSSGQTLIEIIIAIAVGTLIVAASLGLITRANKNSNFAKAQSQANKLSSEGMEIILNIRAVNDCNAVIPHPTYSSGCGVSTATSSWDGLYDIQLDTICEGNCDNNYGHVFRLHEPNDGNCPTATPSWCLHGDQISTSEVKEEVVLDNLTFTREVYIADSELGAAPEGLSKCNNVDLDNTEIKQVIVKVSWVDSAGTHDTKLVNCIARL